jgi:hypothetical protein
LCFDNLKLLGVRKLAFPRFPFPVGVLGAKHETGNAKGGNKEAVSKPVNGAGFQPLSFLLLHSRGYAPGWYEAAPSALKLMRSHIFESAKCAGYISLGQSPRKESQQEIRG